MGIYGFQFVNFDPTLVFGETQRERREEKTTNKINGEVV